jgi:hypothetical protein
VVGRCEQERDASSTSALPVRDDTARLPCLATRPPAAATTKATAVDTLNVPPPSPPVPHVSMSGRGTAAKGIAAFRMARAMPVTSSTVSPFMRSPMARAPIWAGEASPARIVPMTAAASSSRSDWPAATLPSASRIALTRRPSTG